MDGRRLPSGGRGRGRGKLLATDGTPVAARTRGKGFNNYITLNSEMDRLKRERERVQGEQDRLAEEVIDHNDSHEPSHHEQRHNSLEESEQFEQSELNITQTARLIQENNRHREDVEYYYKRRVMIHLERSDDSGDVIKHGLSKASQETLRKTLNLMQDHQEKADENVRLLRHSLWFSKEDVEAHEEWYKKISDGLISLFDQLTELGNTSREVASPTQSFAAPIAASEAYSSPVVEPLKLDKFNGQSGTYRSFKTRFNLVMKRGKIDEGLQAEHLIRCLVGEPLRLVMMVDLENTGALGEMWYKLDKRFGNEQCDYQHHTTELQRLTSYPQCKTDADLKELHLTFTEHINGLRRISRNPDAGEDYKTILCSLLPDYLKRKMNKILYERPRDYTLDTVMDAVERQVGLSNMESPSARDFGRPSVQGYGRDNNHPWARSKVDAERRAQACAGRLSDIQPMDHTGEGSWSLEQSANHSVNNIVTVGDETFKVPGPVARSCNPVHRTAVPSVNHYTFNSCSIPPLNMYATSVASNVGSPSLEVSHELQANAARPVVQRSSAVGTSSALTNQTITLNSQKPFKGCIFCGGDHGPLDCRIFDMGNQYIQVLGANGRCYNCLQTGHILAMCPVDSTCKAQGCRITIKHCHFYCGHFKTQPRLCNPGLMVFSVDASGRFESVRLHTVKFWIVHPGTGKEILVRGFLDGGCTDTLILKEVAQKANLPGPKEVLKFTFTAFFHEAEETDGALVNVLFKSLNGSYVSSPVSCVTMDRLVQDIPSFQITNQQKQMLNAGGYNISDKESLTDGHLPIDVVIGQDLYYKFVGNRIVCPDGLVILDTVFGHTLGGPVITEVHSHVNPTTQVNSSVQQDLNLHDVVRPRMTNKEHGLNQQGQSLPSQLSINYMSCKLPKGISRSINMGCANYKTVKSAIPQSCIPSATSTVTMDEDGSVCLFCGGQHRALECNLFSNRESYIEVLELQGRCYNCLCTGHIVYFCPSSAKCQHPKCNRKGKHSSIICGNGFPSTLTCETDSKVPSCTVNTFRCSAEEEQESIRRLTDLETLGIRPEGKEEDPVLEQFNEDVEEDKEQGRLIIKLPWRGKRKKGLKANFPHAFERTNNSYDKLCKESKQDQFTQYDIIMTEQVEMGILEEIADIGTVQEVRQRLKVDPFYYDHFMPGHEDSSIHYLPHHGVIKPSTGKLRIVYDASAKPFKGAFSLNDCLETGPSLIQPLADILTRFRLKKCAYVADIAKAFLQIVVHPCDRDSLRLIWRKGERVIIYRFNRLPFGLNSSPFVLGASLKFLLESSDFTREEAEKIIQSFYVDDLVSSKDTEDQVLEEREKVKEELGRGGMRLRKWNSNSIELKGLFNKDEEDPLPEEESVLGMLWNTSNDSICINNSRLLKKLGSRNTKEELYSVIAQIFDPMGLLSPYVFLAKVLLHKACLTKIAWKERLSPELVKEWDAWKADLPKLNEVTYERWVSFEEANEFELHGFCDASGEGLAAAVYLVSKGESKVKSRLLRCRTRVNANKPMSMPRREMCAAVLLSLVMHITAEAVKDLNITKKLYYTDSMNALYWISSDHYNWPVFVANRIRQVRNLTITEDWRYVNTSQNPADLPSRGCTIDNLKEHTLFQEGPKFLVTGEPPFLGKMDTSSMPEGCRTEYPKVTLACISTQPKEKLDLQALISTEVEPVVTNSYHRLLKITKLVYKAVALMRSKQVPVNPEHYTREKAELDWIRCVQAEAFSDEINYCKLDKSLRGTKPSLVKALSLFWDPESQVLRCSTRLQDAHIGYTSANPIVLPRDCEFTSMLITAVHRRVCHAGVKQTLSALRAEFWVPQARRIVKKIVNRCVVCRKVTASPYDLPPPPPLPKCRVTMSRPFSNLGVDFCGPFTLKRGKKWYVAIFTCAATRAVHFESLSDLTAESFLLAFKRLIGRRGVPELIISDNAKTFKCVAKKLKRMFKSPVLHRYFMEHRVRWHFYVERAPWHGGFIETCVKLFKGVFKKVAGRSKLNTEEFRTMVCESEQIVNSRPLTYLYEERRDSEPLTPSKLVLGYNLTDLPPIGRGGINEKLAITMRAKYLEKLLNQFWKQWSEDYLHELAERHFSQKKGKEDIREPKVGEVVLLRGEHLPRNRWKMGVIKEVHRAARGNRIRSVIVRIPEGKGHPGGEYRRSPNHLVPLEADFD